MLCLPASPVTFVPLPQTPFGFKSGEEATSRLQELNQSWQKEREALKPLREALRHLDDPTSGFC